MSVEPVMSSPRADTFLALILELSTNTKAVLSDMPRWERYAHLVWLAGPFILLIERSPADSLAITFGDCFLVSVDLFPIFLVASEILGKNRSSFLGRLSRGSAYVHHANLFCWRSRGWFRFPLFAFAVTFWRSDRRLSKLCFSIGLGMLFMGSINVLEMTLVGQVGGRLSWPYGDLCPEIILPRHVSLLSSLLWHLPRRQVAGMHFCCAYCTFLPEHLSDDRRADKFSHPSMLRITRCGCLETSHSKSGIDWCNRLSVLSVGVLPVSQHNSRFVVNFVEQLPFHADSNYYKTMAPGVLAFWSRQFSGSALEI